MSMQEWVAIATCASAVIMLITAGMLVWQIRELKRATYAQAFVSMRQWIQREEIRSARRKLYSLRDIDLAEWTKEDIDEVEKVCHTYDSLGAMTRLGMLPERAARQWKTSLVDCWDIASPLIWKYRAERSHPDLWINFEELASRMKKR